MSAAVGLDIGGANIKVSDGAHSESIPFAMWKHPEQLSSALRRALSNYPKSCTIAATMTGELADCFETRTTGVHFILDSLARVAEGRPVGIWYIGGEFLSLQQAYEFPLLVAAANWHALATWAGRAHPQGTSLLIDIGSTTTDVIPIENGVPIPLGRTDPERMASGELVYTGVRRTPVCSITNHVNIHDQTYGMAAEVFATTLDVALVLQQIPDDPTNLETANGSPATRTNSTVRLARMVCSDLDELNEEGVESIAQQVQSRQIALIRRGIEKTLCRLDEPPTACLVSGEGEYLFDAICAEVVALRETERLSLNKILGASHSVSACAFALSQLASENLPL